MHAKIDATSDRTFPLVEVEQAFSLSPQVSLCRAYYPGRTFPIRAAVSA